jgi:hypothetical protein
MAISGNQRKEKVCVGKHRKQEGVSEGGDQEEFKTGLPFCSNGSLEIHF